MHTRHSLQAAALAAALLFSAHGAHAVEAASRITQVKLYPGSATVERTARVPAGARSFTFRCLPANIDTRSLQVQGDAALRIGEASIRTRERELDPLCISPLDTALREAQDQLATAKAETESLQLSETYLNTVAKIPPETRYAGPGTPGSAAINVTTEALRRSAQDVLQRLHHAKRKQEDAELRYQMVLKERDRVSNPQTRLSSVTVTLASDREAELRLSYQVRGPGWSPSYRATLDSANGKVKLERLALVAQNTGEDWNNVPLVLSTGQPTQRTAGRLPSQWTLDIQPPPTPLKSNELMRMAPAAAPAPIAASAGNSGADAADMPSFDVQTTDNAYATEFNVPQRITVPTGGQRITLTLGTQDAQAQLVTRTAPAVEPVAYLIAQLPVLPGVWPSASVALYRDSAYVGQGTLNNNDGDLARVGLSFGRDERIIVTTEPQQQNAASAGFIGSDTERKVEHAYRIDNRHQRSVELQVLEAAPVSRNQQIRVESQYTPQPADLQWNRQPGLVLWSQTLAPASSARFTATHTLRYPKDAILSESR
ncbi:DUF4139 domain-containing protein [Diaphorobacter sp.]|uniref:DUF4139 domain-containing protein n=1 Tax=Diaphorobacter sp. TaxID=1934310 RepID=UPI0028A83615|nr:DUF4139 domain-containing protein [Diaphorobacter sp.]